MFCRNVQLHVKEIYRCVGQHGKGYKNNGLTIRGGEVDRAWLYVGALKRAISRCAIKGLHTDR